ncbi:MAG: hypothetical protein H7A39_04200 [Chlamydiales bacterium]|nr:hypothetical protein [Chlamydiales bacterium]
MVSKILNFNELRPINLPSKYLRVTLVAGLALAAGIGVVVIGTKLYQRMEESSPQEKAPNSAFSQKFKFSDLSRDTCKNGWDNACETDFVPNIELIAKNIDRADLITYTSNPPPNNQIGGISKYAAAVALRLLLVDADGQHEDERYKIIEELAPIASRCDIDLANSLVQYASVSTDTKWMESWMRCKAVHCSDKAVYNALAGALCLTGGFVKAYQSVEDDFKSLYIQRASKDVAFFMTLSFEEPKAFTEVVERMIEVDLEKNTGHISHILSASHSTNFNVVVNNYIQNHQITEDHPRYSTVQAWTDALSN